MIIEAQSITEKTDITADICIVGAGAAGITLARELINSPLTVALLESGGTKAEQATQKLYRGKYSGVGVSPLKNRARYFGGTTNRWAGWCRPFDEIDFIKREGIPLTGWPIDKTELDPYYIRAHKVCQIGRPQYHVQPADLGDDDGAYIETKRLTTNIFQFSAPPLRFGRAYKEDLEKASNVKVILHANVTDIALADSTNIVDHVAVATLSGKTFTVKAKTFVIAAGGIESARLLLLSNKQHKAGLGNQNDRVGRCFMGHPHMTLGWLMPSDPKPFAFYAQASIHNNATLLALLSLAQDRLLKEKLLNCSVFFPPYMPTSFDKQNNILADHINRTIPEVDCPETYAPGNDASEPGRRKAFQLIIRSQQAPNPESRLTLDSEKDALGLPLSRLNWALTDTDYTLVKRTAEIIAQECGRMGLGRLLTNLQENRQWPDLWAGGHHMGMTRMHSDPKQGVVDRNCKVHGLGNLYVAGPSTFTTGGYANPVLTIVTMALRMADHIKNSFTS